MDVSRIRALRGPNLWSRHTAIEAIVSCATAECAISDLPGFEAGLRARFPAIGELGHRGQASMADALEAAALALQAHAGCPVTFSRTHATVEEGTFQVVVEYTEEKVGRLAFDLAIALLKAAADEKLGFDLAEGAQLLDQRSGFDGKTLPGGLIEPVESSGLDAVGHQHHVGMKPRADHRVDGLHVRPDQGVELFQSHGR